nr:hypothetical protein [Bacteroidota bacterium]
MKQLTTYLPDYLGLNPPVGGRGMNPPLLVRQLVDRYVVAGRFIARGTIKLLAAKIWLIIKIACENSNGTQFIQNRACKCTF